MSQKIYKIVFTGGPCGGKTTALPLAAQELEREGFKVFTVPEVATIVINGGVKNIGQLPDIDMQKYVAVQRQIVRLQLALEDEFFRLAESFSGIPRLILLDRGVMDASAYMPKGSFSSVLKSLNLSVPEIMSRYDSVLHLRSAAYGAEKFYTLDNNTARRERSLDEARLMDDKTREAWEGHENFHILHNEGISFEDKLRHALDHIYRLVKEDLPT